MAADLPEETRAATSALQFGIEQTWRQLCLSDNPSGVDHLIAEVGMLSGDALTPGRKAIRFDFDEKNATGRRKAEAGLEWMGQWHINLAQVNRIDLEHGRSF